jgi:O-antigen/teichoic acid export membrane protein
VQVLQLVLWLSLHGIHVGIWPTAAIGWRETTQVLRRLLGYSVLAHASSLTQFLNHRLDVWVVGYFRGIYDVGLYATAVGVAQLLLLASQSLASVLLPHLAAAAPERSEEMLRTASRVITGFGAALALALFVGGGWVVTILYGDAFSPCSTSLRLLLPGAIAAMTTRVYSTFLAARDCMRYNLRASAAGLIVTVALDLLLIPRLGINGAALATTASYVTTLAACVWAVRFRLGVSLRRAFLPSLADVSIAWNTLWTARRSANA